MTDDEFEILVNEGIEAIPKKFLDLLDNVAITIADEPSLSQVKKYKLTHGYSLLGLYEGVPIGRRGPHYSGVLPDKITIFRRPIERVSGGDPILIKQQVKDTVWHEIAHHFGMDEHEVRTAERNRRARKK